MLVGLWGKKIYKSCLCLTGAWTLQSKVRDILVVSMVVISFGRGQVPVQSFGRGVPAASI